MKLLVLTVLLTLITEIASQSDRSCAITSQEITEPLFNVPQGDDPQLVCTCTGPNIDIIWWCFQSTNCEQNGGLQTGAEYEVQDTFTTNTGTSTLTIRDIQKQDEGQYTCRSTNGIGFSIEIKSVFADVRITLEPEGNAELVYGENMELTCTTDQADIKPVWKKDDQILDQGDNPVGVNDDVVKVNGGKLTIKDGNIQHAGTYVCTVENSERSKTIVLWTKVDITADPSVKVTEGKDGELTCKARSSPQPDITWFIGNQSADGTVTKGNQDDQDDINTQTSNLKLFNVEERVTYTCVATHQWANSTQNILLRVRDKLAWLWPFLVVLGICILLAAIFITLHFKEGQDEGDEEEDEEENPMITGKSKNAPAADVDA